MRIILAAALIAFTNPASAKVISTTGLTCLTLPGGAQFCTNPPAAGATTTLTWSTGTDQYSVTITNGTVTPAPK